MSPTRERRYPLGAALTLEELSGDPHAALARLRAGEPVSWVPCLDGWLVTRHDLALAVMGDSATFTVDDPRFSTAQVIGPSMLSLDGQEHARHRAPFIAPFRHRAITQALREAVIRCLDRLLAALEPHGGMELRRQFAGPLSAAVMAHALGLADDEVDGLLSRYESIVASVTSITAGHGPTERGAQAYAALRDRLRSAIAAGGPAVLAAAAHDSAGHATLLPDEIASNGAVLLFGGIETTEAMITNAALELLRRPEALHLVRRDAGALDRVIDESLRLEPAAAVIDRYATIGCSLAGVAIQRGELVRISIAAANRDPAVFADPDTFDPQRPNLRRHLAFAQGPHVCLGVHLARLETWLALDALVKRLAGLRLDPGSAPRAEGLVFRKPAALHVLWG